MCILTPAGAGIWESAQRTFYNDWDEQRYDVDVCLTVPQNFHQTILLWGSRATKRLKERKDQALAAVHRQTKKKLKGISSEDEPHVEVKTIATEMTTTGSHMDTNVSSKFNQIRERLDKLDSIESSIKEVRDSFQNGETTVNKLKSDVAELDKGVKYIDADLDDFKVKTNEDIALLHKKLLYQEAYSRRENLKLLNIPEQVENAGEGDHEVRVNTKEVVYSFMEDKLQISDARKIEFQRLHRDGKTSGKKPRPILVHFLRFSDRERVLIEARKKFKRHPVCDSRRPSIRDRRMSATANEEIEEGQRKWSNCPLQSFRTRQTLHKWTLRSYMLYVA